MSYQISRMEASHVATDRSSVLLLSTGGTSPVAAMPDALGATVEVAGLPALLAALDATDAESLVVAPVEAFGTTAALRELEWRKGSGKRLRLLLVVEPSKIDLVSASLGYPWVEYVCGPVDRTAIIPGVVEAKARLAAPEAPTLAELGEEAARIAHALSKLAAQLPLASVPAADASVDAPWIRRLIRLRRMRDGYFPPELFADPAWDILLDLTAARLEGVAVSASSLCIAAAVPTTTGLRWIKGMAERGFLVRETDPKDARRVLVSLSDATFARMLECLAALRREGTPV